MSIVPENLTPSTVCIAETIVLYYETMGNFTGWASGNSKDLKKGSRHLAVENRLMT